ncbi:hypothetical protein, partial [Micromonospora sp. XM-20-01]|uniref:hypothetical protein n=1 Tax=Micromonospora sp. XM-20-01 TaxID=2583240 RepID=UPI00202FF070
MATMPAPVGMGLCGCADSQRNSCRFCKEIPSYKRFDDFLSLALPEPGLRTADDRRPVAIA